MKAILTPDVGRKWITDGVPRRDEILSAYGGLRSSDYLPENWNRTYVRTPWTKELSFAIPCREALAALAPFGPWLEIGAGTGYWAALANGMGIDIIATNIPKSRYCQPLGAYFVLEAYSAKDAQQAYPERNILMVWPSYKERWAGCVAQHMRPGQVLALISEGPGGCVADDNLFDELERNFDRISRVEIPQWLGIHDRLEFYRRRS